MHICVISMLHIYKYQNSTFLFNNFWTLFFFVILCFVAGDISGSRDITADLKICIDFSLTDL